MSWDFLKDAIDWLDWQNWVSEEEKKLLIKLNNTVWQALKTWATWVIKVSDERLSSFENAMKKEIDNSTTSEDKEFLKTKLDNILNWLRQLAGKKAESDKIFHDVMSDSRVNIEIIKISPN